MEIKTVWDMLLLNVLSVVAGAISVAIAFYLKDVLEKRKRYVSLKNYLGDLAGVGADVVFEGEIHEITGIGDDGIMIENDVQKVFMPVERVLTSNFVLPKDEEEYERVRLDRNKKALKTAVKGLFDEMKPNILKGIRDDLKEQLGNEKSEISAVFADAARDFLEGRGLGVGRAANKKEVRNQPSGKKESEADNES